MNNEQQYALHWAIAKTQRQKSYSACKRVNNQNIKYCEIYSFLSIENTKSEMVCRLSKWVAIRKAGTLSIVYVPPKNF